MQATSQIDRQPTSFNFLAPAVLFGLFLLLTLAVVSGATERFDRAGLLLFRSPGDVSIALGGAWWQETQRDFTALGSNGVACLLVVVAAVCLAAAKRQRDALYLLACFGMTLLIVALTKQGLARPRPDLVSHVAQVFTTSFPSSHSAISAACCYGAALMIAGERHDRPFRFVVYAGAVLIVLCVGVSRIYLGVHWPSDVIAGWALGLTSATALQNFRGLTVKRS